MLFHLSLLLLVVFNGGTACRSNADCPECPCTIDETPDLPSLFLTDDQSKLLYEFSLSLKNLSCKERQEVLYSSDSIISFSRMQSEALFRVFPHYFKQTDHCKPKDPNNTCNVTSFRSIGPAICSTSIHEASYNFALDENENMVHVIQQVELEMTDPKYTLHQSFQEIRCIDNNGKCNTFPGTQCICNEDTLEQTATALVTYIEDPDNKQVYECNIKLHDCNAYTP